MRLVAELVVARTMRAQLAAVVEPLDFGRPVAEQGPWNDMVYTSVGRADGFAAQVADDHRFLVTLMRMFRLP